MPGSNHPLGRPELAGLQDGRLPGGRLQPLRQLARSRSGSRRRSPALPQEHAGVGEQAYPGGTRLQKLPSRPAFIPVPPVFGANAQTASMPLPNPAQTPDLKPPRGKRNLVADRILRAQIERFELYELRPHPPRLPPLAFHDVTKTRQGTEAKRNYSVSAGAGAGYGHTSQPGDLVSRALRKDLGRRASARSSRSPRLPFEVQAEPACQTPPLVHEAMAWAPIAVATRSAPPPLALPLLHPRGRRGAGFASKTRADCSWAQDANRLRGSFHRGFTSTSPSRGSGSPARSSSAAKIRALARREAQGLATGPATTSSPSCVAAWLPGKHEFAEAGDDIGRVSLKTWPGDLCPTMSPTTRLYADETDGSFPRWVCGFEHLQGTRTAAGCRCQNQSR